MKDADADAVLPTDADPRLHGDLNRPLSRAALLNIFDQCWRRIYLLNEEVTEECEVGGEPEIS